MTRRRPGSWTITAPADASRVGTVETMGSVYTQLAGFRERAHVLFRMSLGRRGWPCMVVLPTRCRAQGKAPREERRACLTHVRCRSSDLLSPLNCEPLRLYPKNLADPEVRAPALTGMCCMRCGACGVVHSMALAQEHWHGIRHIAHARKPRQYLQNGGLYSSLFRHGQQ